MAGLTIFTCPTQLESRLTIEANAQRSWRRLIPSPCVRWVQLSSVDKDEFGTPLVPSVFAQGEALASTDIVAYVNTDIILLQSWLRAIKALLQRFEGNFLMIGQRYDLDLKARLAFERGWQADLSHQVSHSGVLHQDAGIDYFVYRKGMWGEIPPFALGRWSWDNWLVWRALDLDLPVIDATVVATAIHQNHDGCHRGVYAERQRERNEALVRTRGGRLCRIRDATFRLTEHYKVVSKVVVH